MHRILLFASALCFSLPALSTDSYVGSEVCSDCHNSEYKDWQQSHHWHAMAVASEQSVLGDFNNSEFTYNGITSRFYKKGGDFFVKTDNADGQLEEFKITYTFGYEPLQQYLIDFPDGRKQVLSIIWDTRPKSQGGQRWYHLYPESESLSHGNSVSTEEPVDSEDPLHWTGSFFNWNSRCASCHSTELEKNYDSKTNTYNTDWFEINVGCESCHGKGSGHIEWAKKGTNTPGSNKGWKVSLADQGVWQAVEQIIGTEKTYAPTLKRQGPHAGKQKQVCANCHSRRSELQQADVTKAYNDTHKLRLLETPLYHSDGQILDEVYVYGSFLQSKMHTEGVTCSNCHNPHSLELKVGTKEDSNPVCAQCHSTEVFDTPKHHHHVKDSEGAQCVNCHMPETTYMGVDPRRDHSLRIPRPDLSESLNSPNACVQCHRDNDNSWATKALNSWLKESGKTLPAHPYAETFSRIDKVDASAAPDLMKIAQASQQTEIVRASAALRHDGFYRHEDIDNLKKLLADPSPLVRVAAVTSTQAMPAEMRYGLLTSMLDEKVLSVRVEIARNLADIPLYEIPAKEAGLIQALFDDFLSSSQFNADLPETQVMLGLFYIGRRDYAAAEAAYQQALLLAPKYEGALLNLADLYRGMGRDSDAKPLLERAIKAAPTSANSRYSLGLLYIRQQNISAAATQLHKASELQYANPTYAYTYALILEKQQKIPQAINYLKRWQQRNTAHPQVANVLKSLEAKQ